VPPVPSITRWDAVSGADLVIMLDPGPFPLGAGWTSAGLYISMAGDRILHLSGSDRLIPHLERRNSIIVVEADERPYRITRIRIRRIGGEQ